MARRIGSTPAQARGDEGQDRFNDMRVIIDAKLIRDGQQQRVGLSDRLVLPELLDQHVGFGGIIPAEDRLGPLAEKPDAIPSFAIASEVSAIPSLTSAKMLRLTDTRLVRMAGLFPGSAERPIWAAC